ncbi:Thymidylate kinase [hydrothermal vent metagenome]|uniref:Thymidylate kinase n=1 Tax=hydrothermal vent metagenome TaxID=652676 RepID=A0A1W1EJ24_9ZZZZ
MSNSINWYKWSDINLAKQENKIIFLYIGYESSALSNIMESETLSNEKISNILNDNFISIKIDRDERSDIYRYYQKVYKLMNAKDGVLPISVFLTPSMKPIFTSSYLTVEDSEGIMGFETMLNLIIDRFNNDIEMLEEKASEIEESINRVDSKIEATRLDISISDLVLSQARELFDTQNGGFGEAPKFPNISLLELLLDMDKSMVTTTIDGMLRGGFYDKDSGGFYRYSNDKMWIKASDEKSLYDNALISHLLLKANYREKAYETLDFILDNMSSNNLFFTLINNEDKSNPKIEKKIIVSQNAMVIKSLFATKEDKYVREAKESLKALLKILMIDGKLYHSTNIEEKPTVEGFLDDYGYLGEALIAGYRVINDEVYLIEATRLLNSAIKRYYNHGLWKFADGDFSSIDTIYDTNYPSAVATMTSFILSISSLVDNEYLKFAHRTFEIHSYNLMRQPISSPKLTNMVIKYLKR